MSCPFCRANVVEKRSKTLTKQGELIVRFKCSVCDNTFFVELSKVEELLNRKSECLGKGKPHKKGPCSC